MPLISVRKSHSMTKASTFVILVHIATIDHHMRSYNNQVHLEGEILPESSRIDEFSARVFNSEMLP